MSSLVLCCQNSILQITNAIPEPIDVAGRIAQRTLARREAEYAAEVRRLLDAALTVMARCGTAARPRVADIVAEAGLSNDAFYRHFPSKDALVVALVEEGALRLQAYVEHLMGKEPTPEKKVRRWVEGILSQAGPEVGATTRAVLWNGGTVADREAASRHRANAPLADLLRPVLEELGRPDAALVASLCTHAVIGHLSDCLWGERQPGPAEVESIVAFCTGTVGRGRRR
jgi:AcrR family transcriptional regulator